MSKQERPGRVLKAVPVTSGHEVVTGGRASLTQGTGIGSALPAATRELIERLLREGGRSRNAVAREAGVSGTTVSGVARRMGVTFERVEQTAAGTQAARADARAQRRLLAEGLIADAIAERELRERIVDSPRDRADLSRSLGSLVKAVADLDSLEIQRQRLEAAAKDGSDVDTWLDRIRGQAG
jgi:DNA-binding transcriptional ArsR family regulator